MFREEKIDVLLMFQMMRVPLASEGGGPLISLENTDEERSMAIVWMSVSTPDYVVAGYKLYLNGKQCGNMVRRSNFHSSKVPRNF